MKSPVAFKAVLMVVASLALVGPPAECGCLQGLCGTLHKEWQWIDNFLEVDPSRDKIIKYFEENQKEMKPKLRDAFELLVNVFEVYPFKTGCGEPKSLVDLFNALNMNIKSKDDPSAKGVRKLAFESRKLYVESCARKYFEQIEKQVKEISDTQVKSTVESLGAEYAKVREFKEDAMFSTSAELKFTSFVTSSLMGRVLLAVLKDSVSGYKKQLNKETGKYEINWVEIVEGVKRDCEAYQHQVKSLIDYVSEQLLVSRAMMLYDFGGQLWRSWTASVACDRLAKFEVEKVAKKLASFAAKSTKN